MTPTEDVTGHVYPDPPSYDPGNDDRDEYDDDYGSRPCLKCNGSGLFSTCFDDLCHGMEECIHGDDATCPRCHGSGEEPDSP